MSSLPTKFNDPSSQILGKKNDGIREEAAAAFCRLLGGESLLLRSKAVGGGSAKFKSGLFAECGFVSDAFDRGTMNAKIGQFAARQGLQFGDCFAVQGAFSHLLTQSGPASGESCSERRGGYIEFCYCCHRSILYINRTIDELYVELGAQFRNA